MADYTNTLQVARVTGIGVEIKNENVGTGDGSTTSFDLDNGHIVAGSYDLKYSSSASDNSFTSLTESTHYSLEKDGGTIVLTSAGVTALGSNVLWADYTHSPKMSDTILNTYLAVAEAEVEKKTGNYWGVVKSETEIFDGRQSFKYPTTNSPYVDESKDFDEPDKLQLKYLGVSSLDAVYFLKQGVSLSQVERFDSVGSSYVDVTSEANSPGGTAFQPFADTTAVGDYLYVGAPSVFEALVINLFSVGVTSGSNTIEYYNGSSWVAFSVTEASSGILDFEASGKISWSSLSSWSKTTVDSGSELYFVRIKAAAVYSTEAKINTIYMPQDYVIDVNIPLYNVAWDSNGTISLLNNRIPDGNRVVRVDYKHGYTSVPAEISELTALFAGLRVYANITGGSYDDATGFTLGRKSISIGEVYVNVREVVRQFNERIKSILGDVGTKMDLFVG